MHGYMATWLCGLATWYMANGYAATHHIYIYIYIVQSADMHVSAFYASPVQLGT